MWPGSSLFSCTAISTSWTVCNTRDTVGKTSRLFSVWLQGDLELDLSLYLEGSLVLFNGLSHILFSVGLDDLEKLSLANFFFTGSGLLDFKRLSLAFSVLTWSCNFQFSFLCCHFYSSCVVLLWICFLSSSLLVLDYWILIQKNILICLYMKCKMKLLKKMSLMKSFLCNFWTLSGGVGKTRLSKKKRNTNIFNESIFLSISSVA